MLRWIIAIAFIFAGANHFWHPAIYVRITPPIFPRRLLLVYISGFFEVLGGIGLLIPMLRPFACWGLIALLIAVFPANLYMALEPEKFADLHLPAWAYWVRLPLQAVFAFGIWWANRAT